MTPARPFTPETLAERFTKRSQGGNVKRPAGCWKHYGEPNRNGSHEDHVMAKRQLPSPEALRQLLRYEPETGGLFWKERGIEWFRDGRFPASWAQRKWNTRYAGTQAFLAARPDGYLAGTVLNQALKAHRVVWAMCSGSWPVNQIDHINGIRTDNRFENLRDVTHSENGRNQKASGLGSSGITGVTYFKRDGTWRAHIKVNKRFIHIGYFSCKEAATKARKKAEADFGFHPNHGRRP